MKSKWVSVGQNLDVCWNLIRIVGSEVCPAMWWVIVKGNSWCLHLNHFLNYLLITCHLSWSFGIKWQFSARRCTSKSKDFMWQMKIFSFFRGNRLSKTAQEWHRNISNCVLGNMSWALDVFVFPYRTEFCTMAMLALFMQCLPLGTVYIPSPIYVF